MRLFLPHPVLSLGLFVASILLSDSVAPPSIALALLVALAAPHVMRALGSETVRLRAPGAIIRLSALVLADIVRSNGAVAQILLDRRGRDRVSGFLHIPLQLKHPYGLAVLAIILTSTPGTLWVEYDRGSGRLLLHVLDLVDEERWVALVKGRYETLLLRIFE
ncbi:Na+/H+ antiporter subunit E [Brevundimonas lutea]|uniref:Na+/H+ antiporter subunit E n=1 Tax=Brevundimonas lutea TaxID=2293980 RepID=UPI000F01A50A|nr:Na+/H+ antiporter subunit E [Brevundimonas lutea]